MVWACQVETELNSERGPALQMHRWIKNCSGWGKKINIELRQAIYSTLIMFDRG